MAAFLPHLRKASGFEPALDLGYASGLSRANLDLDGTHLRWACRLRWFKMKLEGFSEILECLVFGGALTGYVDFQAL